MNMARLAKPARRSKSSIFMLGDLPPSSARLQGLARVAKGSVGARRPGCFAGAMGSSGKNMLPPPTARVGGWTGAIANIT